MEGQQFNITEGSSGSITCTATGYPVPTVVWQNSNGSSLSNNRLVSGSPLYMSTGVGNVTSISVELMVIGALRVDTGMYRCSANNSVGSTTRNINITVQCKLQFMTTYVYFIHFYQFGTGGRSQMAVKPVRCDYLKPWGDLLESIRVGQLINFKSKKICVTIRRLHTYAL